MKIISNSKSIGKAQSKVDQLMIDVEEEYLLLANRIYKETGFLKKMFSIFSMPPSLRFYHIGERFSTGDEELKLLKLRKIYHNAWSLKNQFLDFTKNESDSIVYLDSFETETLVSVAEYLGIDYGNYRVIHNENSHVLDVVNL